MKKNRTLTESGAYFPRCVALPARETLLLEEEMMLYMGQSGGVTRTVPRRSNPPYKPVINLNPANPSNSGHVYDPPDVGNVQRITHAGGAGVIPTGSGSPADSTRTSAEIMQTWYRQTPPDSTGSPPTNSDSQTEDTSESLWDTVKDWLGF